MDYMQIALIFDADLFQVISCTKADTIKVATKKAAWYLNLDAILNILVAMSWPNGGFKPIASTIMMLTEEVYITEGYTREQFDEWIDKTVLSDMKYWYYNRNPSEHKVLAVKWEQYKDDIISYRNERV